MALLINASIVQKLDLARPIECPAALGTVVLPPSLFDMLVA